MFTHLLSYVAFFIHLWSFIIATILINRLKFPYACLYSQFHHIHNFSFYILSLFISMQPQRLTVANTLIDHDFVYWTVVPFIIFIYFNPTHLRQAFIIFAISIPINNDYSLRITVLPHSFNLLSTFILRSPYLFISSPTSSLIHHAYSFLHLIHFLISLPLLSPHILTSHPCGWSGPRSTTPRASKKQSRARDPVQHTPSSKNRS